MQDDTYKRMWQRSIDEALAQLSSTSQEGLLFIGKRRGSRLEGIIIGGIIMNNPIIL